MSNGLNQLTTLISKNYIEKKRNIRNCCCEYFSHLIILLLLVFGYSLSEITYYEAETYSSLNFTIPPDWFVDNTINFSPFISTLEDIFSGPIIVPNFDSFVLTSRTLSNALGEDRITELATSSSTGQTYGNLLKLGTLHFAPDSDEVDNLIKYLNDTTATFNTLTIHKHKNEGNAINYIQNHLDEYTWALIVVHSISPSDINYEIRLNYTTLPNTNEIVNWVSIGLDTTYQRYFFSGFLSLQNIIDDWAFDYINNQILESTPIFDDLISNISSNINIGTCKRASPVTMPFPTAAFDQNIFFLAVGFLLGLAMTMATMYPMSRLVKSVVEEKESKMREVMKIMGLHDWAHQGAWFINAFILFFWISISSTFVCHNSFLPKTDPFLLFIYFFSFCLSEITFSFLIASFFSKAKLAAMVAPVILFASVLPRFIFYSSNPYEQQQSKFFASLLSPTAFTFGADIIANYEYAGIGVQTYNMDQGLFSFSDSIRMMFVDFIIYGILAWYLDQVIPLDIGTPKHPLFIFHLSYWFPVWAQKDVADFEFTQPMEYDPSSALDTSSIQFIPEQERSKSQVLISHLRKRYPDGRLAIKDFSICFLQDQITCLLGHNGAGKTTTLSILTGLIEPTHGDCLIWGYQLSKHLPAIRQLTGICPQQNVLFPSLTVEEHLTIFGKIKGLSGSKLKEKVTQSIEDIGLTEKRHVLSSALSGGMKRKLCLAMALVGDPKFVLLDEPTSGMDPYSRRSTWELLQKYKTGRVIILTTHFMDEADILGDRIAIMSDGKLRCSGSPLFLKTRFGAGYVLSISRNQINNKDNENQDSNLLHLIQNTIPEAKISSTVAGEVIFNLPITSAPLFGKLFQDINLKKDDFLISSYGICITTLEQVFIQLAHENHPHNNNNNNNNLNNHDNEDDDDDIHDFNNVLHHSSQFLLSLFAADHKSNTDRRIISPEEDKIPPEVEMIQKEKYAITNNNHPNQEIINNSIAPSAQYIPIQPEDSQNNNNNNGNNNDNIKTNKFNNFGEHLITGWNENQYFEKTWIQLTELLRKRLVIALRDGNGLFFQLILPAIQIALILSILMINVNPAGSTLTLNAAMFPVHPTALLSEGASVTLRQLMIKNNLNDHRMKLLNTNSTTSEESSIYMLDTYSTPGGNRFGSYVFDDKINANITVNWSWVQSNVDLILNNSDIIINILEDFGIIPDTFDLNDLISLNETFNFDLPNIILDNLNITSGDGSVNITEVINDLIDNLFDNSTTITFLNQTFNEEDVKDFLESLLLPQNSSSIINITNGNIDGDIQVESIKIIDGKITLIGVTIEVNDVTVIELGNITLTGDQIKEILPNTTETYSLKISSPYSILHNTSSPHAVGAFIGELNAAVFEQCSNVNNTRYKSKNHPLPLTAEESLEIQVILSIFASLFILIPLCYIPASFVVFVVRERESKSKHLQIVSSVSPYLYWIATYIWDMGLFCILTGLIMITLFSYGEDASKIFISTPEATFAVFLLLILYGTSAIPISYIYSFAFDNHSTAQISIMTVNFFTGFVAVLAYYIMVSIPSTKSTGETLVHFFRIFPPYNIGEGLINIAANYFANELAEQNISYLSWKVSGRNIAHLGIETGVYMTIVLLSESSWLRRIGYFIERKIYELGRYEIPPNIHPLDQDIINETKLVNEYDPNNSDYMLVLKNIIKTYPPTLFWGEPKHAVRGIDLACAAGERFGLLGINGAGKSTTLGILTGDIQPTRGEAYISGFPLSDPSTRNLIGYCPQTDPLLDLMTGYDTLWFFGRVRGLEENYLHTRCLELIDEVGLTNHAYKPCGSYSGGNKRKLSLAVALIGNPKVLFLDEPSSGMDPEARRHMWEVITKVSSDRSVVITTHSMEECEAICSRISIMVSGRIQCIGSTQHLKSRYGTGYELNVSFIDEQKKIQFTQQLLNENNLFNQQNTILEEEHLNYIRYKLMISDHELSNTFEYLETMKINQTILNYSLSQCTLEQIFINFAKFQEEEKKK